MSGWKALESLRESLRRFPDGLDDDIIRGDGPHEERPGCRHADWKHGDARPFVLYPTVMLLSRFRSLYLDHVAPRRGWGCG